MPGNQHEKLSLDEAAHKVNISKKSLDDYLFQIRFGHKFHFNFNEHYNDKVGVLRDFVRSKKNADKQMKTKIEKQKNWVLCLIIYWKVIFYLVFSRVFFLLMKPVLT